MRMLFRFTNDMDMYRVPARFVTRCAGVGGNELYSNELRNGVFVISLHSFVSCNST